jgi:hypothetical protein
MKNLKIVWTAVIATAFSLGAFVSGLLGDETMVFAWGLSAITMAILSVRENL